MKQRTSQRITLTGRPNLGDGREQRKTFVVKQVSNCIRICDDKGHTLISFAPFFDGGSVWVSGQREA